MQSWDFYVKASRLEEINRKLLLNGLLREGVTAWEAGTAWSVCTKTKIVWVPTLSFMCSTESFRSIV